MIKKRMENGYKNKMLVKKFKKKKWSKSPFNSNDHKLNRNGHDKGGQKKYNKHGW